jgi:hypothetical protein
MLNKILTGFILLLFLTVSTGAVSMSSSSIRANIKLTDVTFAAIKCETLTYEDQPLSSLSVELPSDISTVLNNETINLEITNAANAKKTVSGKVNNNILSELSCSSRNDASLNAYVTTDVLAKIANSTDPLKTFKEAKANGEISFKPIGFVAGVKLFFADLFLMFQ